MQYDYMFFEIISTLSGHYTISETSKGNFTFGWSLIKYGLDELCTKSKKRNERFCFKLHTISEYNHSTVNTCIRSLILRLQVNQRIMGSKRNIL